MSEPIELSPPQQAVSNDLIVTIRNNALDAPAAQTVLDAYTPFYAKARKLVAQATLFLDDPAPDAKIARTLRLALKDERVGAEKTRKTLNESALRYTKAVNGVNAVIVLLTEPIEDRLEAIEKAEEIAEAGRRASLKGEREELLRPFKVDTQFYALDTMPAASFERLLADTKTAYEAKIAAELVAEAERIKAERAAAEEKAAKEKAEAEERERLAAENARLQAEKDAAEAKAKAEREKAEAEAKAEREKVAKEKAAAAAKAKRERDEIEAKAKAEREALEAKAAAEKAESDRIAAEERAKREALEKAEADRVAAEKKRQDEEAAAIARAAAAPDRDKLLAFAALVQSLEVPAMDTLAGEKLAGAIGELIAELVAEIRAKASRL